MQKSTTSDKGKKGASAAHDEEDDNVVAPSKGTKLPHFSGDANTFGDFLFVVTRLLSTDVRRGGSRDNTR